MAENADSDDFLEALPLQRFLTYRLLRVHSKLNTQATRILGKVSGLSLTQWRVLAMVATHDGATHTDISRLSQIDKGQLSRCIRALIVEGLIVARDDEQDSRQQHLSLSAEGRALYDRTVPRMQARQRFLLNHLTPVERDAIYSALDKLEIAAETMEIPE